MPLIPAANFSPQRDLGISHLRKFAFSRLMRAEDMGIADRQQMRQ